MKILCPWNFYLRFLMHLSILLFSRGLTINSNEIRDLESNSSYFQQEASFWTVKQTLTSSNISKCAGTWLLGGYGIIADNGEFNRQYLSLPPHDTVYFSVDAWLIDIPENQNLFAIYFDNNLVKSFNSNDYTPGAYSSLQVCGASKKDIPFVTIGGNVKHNASQLLIKVLLSNNKSGTFAIGIRNLNLLFKITSDISTSICSFVLPSNSQSTSCLCPKGYYDSPGSIGCSACNSLCKTCSGSSNMSCTSCKAGYSFNAQTCFKCDSTCNQCTGTAPTDCIRCNIGSYLYPNGTCQLSCNPPLLIRTEGDYSFCDLPCNKSAEYFYQNNKTCLSNCSAPLIQYSQGDLKLCSLPCSSPNFIYWNGSCAPSCPTLFQSIFGSQNYCKFHCNKEEYFYWNSSCLPSCPSPLIQTIDSNSYKYCNLPCTPGQFLLSNGSCGPSCDFNIISSSEGVSICSAPCSKNEYYYQNETCLGDCSSPFKSGLSNSGQKLCNAPCQLGEFYIKDKKACFFECPPFYIAKQEGLLRYCDNVSIPVDKSPIIGHVMDEVVKVINIAGNVIRPDILGTAFRTALVKLVRYVKFINVPIQKDILGILDSNISSVYSVSITFYLPMPENLEQQFQKRYLPLIFGDHVNHSSYLVNNWNSFTTFFILFLFGILCYVLEICIKKSKKRILVQVMKRVRTIAHWNFLLCIIFNTYDDLTLFAILEFQSVEFDSVASAISFLICIWFSVAALYLLGVVYVINKQALKMKSQITSTNTTNSEILFYKKWKHYQVTYAGYKNISFASQGYLFWFICRIIILYLIVGFLYNYPLAQTIQLTIMSLLMLSYLLKVKPINDTFSYYVSLIFETLVLIMNVSLLLLSIFDKTHSLTFERQEDLSYMILVLNIMIDILGNLVMWMYIIITIRAAYISSKKYGLSGKTNWLSVLVVAYQSPGMDFHEISNHDISDSDDSRVQPKQSPIQGKKISAKQKIAPVHPPELKIPYFIRMETETLKTSNNSDSPQLETHMSSSPTIDTSPRRLKIDSPLSKFRRPILEPDLERIPSIENDIEGVSSLRKPMVNSKMPLTGCLSANEKGLQMQIPEDCEDISECIESAKQDLENRASNMYTANEMVFSMNSQAEEIILNSNIRQNIGGKQKKFNFKEIMQEKNTKDEEYSLQYSPKKMKIKARQSRIELFKINKINEKINISVVNSNQFHDTENTNNSFEFSSAQTSERVFDSGNTYKPPMSKFFNGRSLNEKNYVFSE